MDKIGIVTFHHAKHSHGAFLQALATLRMVQQFGYNAEIVNYENAYEQKEIKSQGKNWKEKLMLRLNWCVRMSLFHGYSDPGRKAENLDRLYGSVSDTKYTSIEALNRSQYDVLLAGSDQIWNPAITNGVDEAFLLQFGHPKKRISYASSVGSHQFTQDELVTYESALKNFDSISVREKYAADILQPICHTKIQTVCDPTLLMTGQQWREEFANSFQQFGAKKPYILTYFVGGNINSYWEAIEKYTDKINLPIYNIQSHSKPYPHVDKAIYNILPNEMVAYIENAAVIITDSFHGVAFSVNLNKDFIAILNKKNPIRVLNLLEELGLENRIDGKIEDCLESVDYSVVNPKLERLRTQSIDWLQTALKN